MVETIGKEEIDVKKVEEMLHIFASDKNGKKIKNIQIIAGKLNIKYEDGE